MAAMTDKQQKRDSAKSVSKSKQANTSQPLEAVPERTPDALHCGAGIQRALATPPSELRPNQILTLQHATGNRAVSRLLAQKDRPQSSSPLPVQARLIVSSAKDLYEQEADRVAAQVMGQFNAQQSQAFNAKQSLRRQPADDEELKRKPLVQFKSTEGGMDVSADLETSIQAARSGGQPLAENVRASMEGAFGTNFSSVKVHTDTEADALNRSIQARAFTTGQDVFFRQGEYNPGTTDGQRLIAHELTHVMQQSSPAARRIQDRISSSAGTVLQRALDRAEAGKEVKVWVASAGELARGVIASGYDVDDDGYRGFASVYLEAFYRKGKWVPADDVVGIDPSFIYEESVDDEAILSEQTGDGESLDEEHFSESMFFDDEGGSGPGESSSGAKPDRQKLDKQDGDEKSELMSSIEQNIAESETLSAEVDNNLLTVDKGHQYLANRFAWLKKELNQTIAQYRSRKKEEHSLRFLRRTRGALAHPDRLPLLRQTVKDLRLQLRQMFKIPTKGTLTEKLTDIFEQAAAKELPVRFMQVAVLIRTASDEERAAAADDEELIGAASRRMAPDLRIIPYDQGVFNDFPQFVSALGVHQKGSVEHHDVFEVDTAIRQVLGEWVDAPVQSGVQLPGHVVVLKDRYLKAVQAKYALSLPGGGKVNAFTEQGTLYLGSSRGEPSTIVHEGIHLYAEGSFRRVFGDTFDEGVTEYFARLVATTLDYERDKYQDEYTAASEIIAILSVDIVARAYFEGNIDVLMQEFFGLRKRHGVADEKQVENDWKMFLQHLKDKKWELAKALLR